MRGRRTADDLARYRRVDRLLDETESLPDAERATYLARAAAGDADLQADLDRLRAGARRTSGDFLASSALEELAGALAGESPRPPAEIAGYRVLAPLGSGGMADVFLAEDVRLGRQVALKILPDAFADDDGRLARFAREARAVSSLNHPNILTLHDIVDGPRGPCLVLEFVEGETLRSRLQRGRLTPLAAVQVAIQVTAALNAAHRAGVLHRDIKPENVMVRADGVVKVLDFGLAKLAAPGASSPAARAGSTAFGLVLGTPNYMSPEQAAGGPVDARSDLYALGLVLSEAVQNRPPELARIIERLLRPDRDERYPDAVALLADLNTLRLGLESAEEAAAGETTSVGVGPSRRSGGASRATRIAVGFAAVAAILASAGLVLRRPGEGVARDAAGALVRRDPVLLAEVTNATGDPTFDATLTQALAVYLEQTPYLSLFPEQAVRETLIYMKLPPERPLSPEVLREVCERAGIKAMVGGRLAALGERYVVTLEATEASTGRVVASALAEADGRERVLRALRDAASQLRLRLGESLPSLRAHDVPLEQATTASLEALRSYALGRRQLLQGRTGDAIPLLVEALRRDPAFASAHAQLAAAYRTQGNNVLDRESASRAYALRERVSERESLLIAQQYESYVLGDLDRAIATLRRWRLSYPRDAAPASVLSSTLMLVGRYEEAIEEAAAAIALHPVDANAHTERGLALAILGRGGEARAALNEAESRGITMQRLRYSLDPEAWLRAAAEARRRPVERASGPAAEAIAANREAAAATDRGERHRAAVLAAEAIAAARLVDPGLAGRYGFEAILRAASYGHCEEVAAAAPLTLALTDHAWARSGVALGQALCGREPEARKEFTALIARHPHDTLIQRAARPAILAVLAARAGQFDEALERLASIRPYEMGTYAALWPVYIRGLVLSAARRHGEAAAEFERVIDYGRLRIGHPFSPSPSIARFHLARAAELAGEGERARRNYQEVLAIWSGAEPDLAVLAEARAAFARLTKALSPPRARR